jgi:hypothetical protein
MSEEEEAIKELMSMSQTELDLVPYDTVKLICQAKGCKRHTKARDYGLSPVYYVKGFKQKDRWHNVIKSYFLCAKHWKLIHRLLRRFEAWRVEDKILDLNKQNIEKS